MKIIQVNDSSLIKYETAAIVGFFDGVHQGHRYLIDQLKMQSRKTGLKTVAITFPVHPRKVLNQDYQPKLLCTFDEKIKQLASTGINYCYVIDFTKDYSEITAQDFIRQKLYAQLGVRELLIGYDHRFGKGRINGYVEYVEYGKQCGMKMLQARKFQEGDTPVSSTVIRNFISEGKIKKANHFLSYYYSFEGKVIQGNKLGRTIGFPTANLELIDPDKITPREGVYAAHAIIEGEKYTCMLYIGKRPTIKPEGEKRIEAHIFGFDKDIYDVTLRIEIIDFLREDNHFNNLDKLKEQLIKDKENAIRLLHNK
jgi:riboflavin kinase/FMN adenylyltransferase